jgi:cyclase
MKWIGTTIFLLIANLVQAADQPVVSSQEIAEGLYLLQGRGGNVLASMGSDGLLLIDDDYAELAPAYEDALGKLGKDMPHYVINTHWHGDHAGGNTFWGERGAIIVAHDNVRKRVSNDQNNAFFGRTTPAMAPSGWPVVSYADSMALHFNYDTLQLQHYPNGHTDGDTVVFFVGSNVVHMGDHFFKDRFPFIDIDSGGSADGYLANIKSILHKVDGRTIIVPGHGDLADRSDLQRYLQMLEETRTELAQMKAEGLSLKAMQERGLNAKWQSWGGGFINQANYISFVAASL